MFSSSCRYSPTFSKWYFKLLWRISHWDDLAHIPLYLYPFLNTTNKSKPFENVRVTSLGVIGALVKVFAQSPKRSLTTNIGIGRWAWAYKFLGSNWSDSLMLENNEKRFWAITDRGHLYPSKSSAWSVWVELYLPIRRSLLSCQFFWSDLSFTII